MNITEMSMVVSWIDPILYAPAIEEYTIRVVSDEGHEKTITESAGQRAVKITDLISGFSYDVSVVVTYKLASFMSAAAVVNRVTLHKCEGKF